jgi:hypothetical protein
MWLRWWLTSTTSRFAASNCFHCPVRTSSLSKLNFYLPSSQTFAINLTYRLRFVSSWYPPFTGWFCDLIPSDLKNFQLLLYLKQLTSSIPWINFKVLMSLFSSLKPFEDMCTKYIFIHNNSSKHFTSFVFYPTPKQNLVSTDCCVTTKNGTYGC